MARIRMVTRTVKGVSANVLCMNVTQATAVTRNYTIGGTFASDAELLKALQKANDTDKFKLVSIVSKSETEQLFGMTEEMFIRLAEKMPPRSTVEDGANEE